MIYNNFSDWYKKALVNSENKIKTIWLKNLKVEDVFLEIVKNSIWWIKELFNLYWIDEKLTIEIISKWLFNELPEKRKWVYSGMDKQLKDAILWSVKVAASFSKQKASIEDFLLSILDSKIWINWFLDYVWINYSEFEKWLIDLNNNYYIDWNWDKSKNKNFSTDWIEKIIWDWNIEKILWALWNGMFLWDEWKTTPFDNNKQSKKDSNTPALDFFSNDLTKEAKDWKIDKIIWREQEIERLIAILNRKTKNNPVLVWDPWVWKTSVVEWLAIRIEKWEVPFSMKNKKIFALDMSSMVAWTKYRWEFETRIKQVIEEASKVENEVILFIDEIHTIIWAWSWEWTLDASNILKPAMWRWKIRVIWATTLNEYQKYIEKDSALERRFQKIVVSEPNKEVAHDIIWWLKEVFEEYHNLNITDWAIEEAVNLSIRYITDRFLPDKAIDLIDEACSLKSMKYNFEEEESQKLKEKISKLQSEIEQAVISQSYKKASKLKEQQKEIENEVSQIKQKFNIPKEKRLNVTEEDVQKVLSISTWIPISNLSKSEITKLKKLPLSIKNKIIGQEDAIESIVKSILRSKTWIWDTNRPLWSFLFLGPTWVWKTELVKVLAKEFYDSEDSLIKIDMSEYSDKTSINKLIWASAWYVWYEEWGLLTEKVRKKPYCVLLFDEIEKWDFEIFNLLLQILEEWIATDNKWRKINFKNTIIVMTSNIWQEEFSKKASQIWFNVSQSEEDKIMNDYKKAKETIVWNLTDYFSPEFINRIDKIVVFNPLDKTQIKKIIKLQLENLKERVAKKQIEINYDNSVLNFITKVVYNPDFWAREVRRYIIDNIEDNIAENIVNDPSKKIFTIKIEKDKLIII